MPTKEWTADHKEHLKQYHAAWRAKNQNKIRGYRQKTRKHHRDELNTKNRLERKLNGDHVRKRDRNCRESSVENFISWRWSQTKSKHHNKKALKYTKSITAQYLIDLWSKQNGKCAVSGKQMAHKSGSLYTVSVDRIDSNVGYIEGNVQLVCQAINLGKGAHTNAEIIAFWNER